MRVVSVIGIGCLAVLAGCAGAVFSPQIPGPTRAPALDVLALDFERTTFDAGSSVSGSLAQKQRGLRLSWRTSGLLRQSKLHALMNGSIAVLAKLPERHLTSMSLSGLRFHSRLRRR